MLCLFGFVPVILASNGPADGPRVCVKNLVSGLMFPIHVRLNSTIWEIKETISRLHSDSILPSKQELRFQDQTLDDNQSLDSYSIRHHSELELSYDSSELKRGHANLFKPIRPPPTETGKKVKTGKDRKSNKKPATLELWTPGTNVFSMNVDLTDTVEMLKKKIEEQEEYSGANQIIFNKQKHLSDDSKTLESYDVRDGSRLSLIVPPSWCETN